MELEEPETDHAHTINYMLMGNSGSSKRGVGVFSRVVSSLKNTPTSHAVSLALFYVHMQ